MSLEIKQRDLWELGPTWNNFNSGKMKVNRVAFIKWLEFRPTVQGFDIPQTVHMFQPRQLQCDNWRISSEGELQFCALNIFLQLQLCPSSEEKSGLLQVLGIISLGCHPSLW